MASSTHSLFFCDHRRIKLINHHFATVQAYCTYFEAARCLSFLFLTHTDTQRHTHRQTHTLDFGLDGMPGRLKGGVAALAQHYLFTEVSLHGHESGPGLQYYAMTKTMMVLTS